MTAAALRLATEADLPAINDIYNYYVPRSTCTYQTEPETIESRTAWFREHSPDKYPVTVAGCDGEIVGWGSPSRFRERAAYAPTVEGSVYIRHDAHRRDLGRLILTDLIERARQAGFHSFIGGAISSGGDQFSSNRCPPPARLSFLYPLSSIARHVPSQNGATQRR